MQDKDRQVANAGASTSAPVTIKSRIPTHAKGKKTPSRSDTPMASAGSRQLVPSRVGNSLKSRLDGGDSDGGSSSIDSDGNIWGPIGRPVHKKKLGQRDCEGSRGCGMDTSTPAQPLAQIRFDIKPKDPPAYHGKATKDIEVWSQQVDNYL